MTNWPGFTSWWALYTHDMAHRHVLIGYAFAWAIQLGYLCFVLRQRSQNPSDRPPQS